MEVIAINRFGLSFGRSKRRTTYSGSGRSFASYYTHVCLRCGWHFKPPRHLSHRLEDCNMVLVQVIADKPTRSWVSENLHGRRRRK